MKIVFYPIGDFYNRTELEGYTMRTRIHHGRCEAVLHPANQKQETYYLNLAEYVVEVK